MKKIFGNERGMIDFGNVFGSGQRLVVSNAVPQPVGPGQIGKYALTEFDYYDRMFLFNDANLAGQSIDFFQQGIGDSYTPINGTSANSITKKLTDTNFDLKGQTAYTMLIHGISVKLNTLRAKNGTSATDLTSWPLAFNNLLEDCAVEFLVNDTLYDRFKPTHAPAGGGATGVSAVATTVATTSIVTPVMANGITSAQNYKNYSKNPLQVPMGQRVKVRLTFGASCLSANYDYKPASANSGVPEIFYEIRLIGTRANAVQ